VYPTTKTKTVPIKERSVLIVSMKDWITAVKHRILALDARLITALSELNGVVPPVNSVGCKSTESPERTIGRYGNIKEAHATSASVLKGQAGEDYR
jgi:hypothetical protein